MFSLGDENPKDKPICCKTLVFQHRACRHLWSIIWLRDATQRDHASCLGELATPCGTSAPLWQFDGSGGKSSPGNVALPFWHVPCPLGDSPWVFKTNVVYRAAPPPQTHTKTIPQHRQGELLGCFPLRAMSCRRAPKLLLQSTVMKRHRASSARWRCTQMSPVYPRPDSRLHPNHSG